jgi:DprA-like N-terminal HHH domain
LSEGVKLSDEQRVDWLRLIRSDHIGPRGIMAQTPQEAVMTDRLLNDAPYRQKATELLTLLEADHVPPWVKLMVPRLSECHNKLFVQIGEPDRARRANDPLPGIYPSNLLCELVEAIRALDWPKVRILVHDALTSDLVRLRPNTGPPHKEDVM